MNLRDVTGSFFATALVILLPGCQGKPSEDQLQLLQNRVDDAYVHVSEAREQLARLNSENRQDGLSKAREATEAAFVDVQNAQYALKKMREAQ